MNSFPGMEWNAKWDWESLNILSSNVGESPKKLQATALGIEEGDIDGGSFNLSGGYGYRGSGDSTSGVGHVSSAKSSISASTNCSSKEGMKASNITFDSDGGFPGYFGKQKELSRAELSGTSPSLETSLGSDELLIGLKLGKSTYFENSSAGSNTKTSYISTSPVSSAATAKKIRSSCQNATTPRCQVESCNLDLSSAKEYYQKHRICVSHSKCPKVVVVGGLERRFCQQCSMFHGLLEFDENKRSCRKRLSHHNARRRKPKQEMIKFNSTGMSSSIYEGGKHMSFVLSNDPLTHTRPNGNSTWGSTYSSKYALANGYLLKPENAGVIDVPNHDSVRLLQYKGRSEVLSQGFKESMFSSNLLDASPDLGRALSLLSKNSWGSCEPESSYLNYSMNATHTGMPPHVMQQSLPLALTRCWQTQVPSADAGVGNHYQETQLFPAPYESGFYSN